MESAPTIPSERAIFDEIDDVIVYPTGASNKKFKTWYLVFTHSKFKTLNGNRKEIVNRR